LVCCMIRSLFMFFRRLPTFKVHGEFITMNKVGNLKSSPLLEGFQPCNNMMNFISVI